MSSYVAAGLPLTRPHLRYVLVGMEALWLAAAFLVPIAILPERTLAFVDTPKVSLLRAIACLIAVLWVWEWALAPRVSGGRALKRSIGVQRRPTPQAIRWRPMDSSRGPFSAKT